MSKTQKKQALLDFHKKQYELNIGKMHAAEERATMHLMSIKLLMSI